MKIKEGIYPFYKPSGISSAGFLNGLKRELEIPKGVKVGHGGTLDPFAEGLIVVGIGREYTKKLSEYLKNLPKTYEAEVVLGKVSDTYDREGGLIEKYNFNEFPSDGEIKEAIKRVSEKKEQIPPAFSAIKVGGEESYKKARRGDSVELESRNVKVLDYEIKDIKRNNDEVVIDVKLKVESGYYIRSFANDVGEELGTGAYLNKLVRTDIGDISVEGCK